MARSTALLVLGVVALALVIRVQSACIPLSTANMLDAYTLTAADISTIVRIHDVYKETYPGHVYNMHLYHWSDELAALALQYAKNCVWAHSDQCYRTTGTGGFGYIGENLAAGSSGSPTYDPPGGVTTYCENWAYERNDYTHSNGACKAGKACGHYTQMVWADTTHIGCGLAKCKKGTIFGSFDAWYFVCHYGQGGNINGQLPAPEAGATNPCYSNPCGTHGVCSLTGNTHHCECEEGYSSPGGNGACVQGNSGNNDPCHPLGQPDPCGIHGVCNNGGSGPNGYTCTCAAGWGGNNCDTQANPCTQSSCSGHGTCSPGAGGAVSCQCQLGWTGNTCSVADNPCNPNPCEHGGVCTANGNSFTCACNGGYGPPLCHDLANPNQGSGSNNGAPATSTFEGKLFNLINNDRSAKGLSPLQYTNNQYDQSKASANTCPTTVSSSSGVYKTMLTICGIDTDLDVSLAPLVFNFWSGGAWWNLPSAKNAACEHSDHNCAGCGGPGSSRVIVCSYTTGNSGSGEVEEPYKTTMDHPMDYGRATPGRDFQLHLDASSGSSPMFLVGCVVAVVAVIGLVAVAVVVRSRRQAAAAAAGEYVEMNQLE